MATEDTPNHVMHHVGTGRIWCCAVCGWSVEVIQGTPTDKACYGCYGSFQGQIDWLYSTIRANVESAG